MDQPTGLGGPSDESDSLRMGATRAARLQPSSIAPSPFAVWGQGFVDHEERDPRGGFSGSTTNIGGTIGGVDYTFRNVFSASDAFVFGVLSGYATAQAKSTDGITKTHVEGPSVGIYGVYVSGGFSVDFNSKVDFFGVDQTGGFSADLTNSVTAANLNYKINAPASVGGWVEPTVGMIYTDSNWGNGQSALDGHQLRVQGGVRFGQSLTFGEITVEPTLTGLLYSDVVIEGGTVATIGQPAAPTDQGKLFEQALFKLNFDFGNGLSSSVEGDVRHSDMGNGTQVVGAGGRVAVRYQW
jgi:Autotransporter beta-domain